VTPSIAARPHVGARTRPPATGTGTGNSAAAPDSVRQVTNGSGAGLVADDPAAVAALQDMEVALRSAYNRSLPRPGALSWRSRYQLAAFLVDLAASVLAVVGAFLARFGDISADLQLANLTLLAMLPAAWLASAGLNRAYEVRILGAGATEFERIGKAFLHLTAITTFAAYVTRVEVSRALVLLALPATLTLSVLGRYALRKAVHRSRKSGRATVPVLAVGGAEEIAAFSDTLLRNGHAGLRVTAACVVPGNEITAEAAAALAERGIPVAGDVDSIRDAVLETGASTVAVIAHRISSEKLRWISWQLEGTDADLALMPGLTEVAGRRLSIQQVGELPLLYVAEPEFTGLRRVIKGAFDRAVALLAVVLLAPLLLGIAATVRLTSRGPALFLQTRVGKNGKTFRMVKFRSMVVDAEHRVEDLDALNEVPGGTLFKIRQDPRVTRVGRILRRFSLDEVPQLLNVVTGSMSLVGPRPPLPREVATYGGDVRRRLLVKPGMTGLWQISGRSDLTWEESVRIDLRYVENWSLSLDLLVIVKTARAVLRADGAY
jgi:exopolysaccharide biosynthesis polyprenyl glycosylphosphotransferase